MSDKMCGSEKERKIYWVPPYTSSQQFDIKKYILSTELSNKLIKIIMSSQQLTWCMKWVYILTQVYLLLQYRKDKGKYLILK